MICIKIPFPVFLHFLMICSNFVGLLNLYLMTQPRIIFVKKIKQIVFDHCFLIEHRNQTHSGDTNTNETPHPVPTQEIPSASASTPKRKRLFGNIEYDPKHGEKVKTMDSYNYIKEEITRYINDDNNGKMIFLNITSSTVKKRYRTEPKKVLSFATNSKPFCDIVRKF